jgi:putative ABC transport system substrate-binding protein
VRRNCGRPLWAKSGQTASRVKNQNPVIGRSEQIARLTLRHRVPSIFQYRSFVVAGGLISYGSNYRDTHYQLGLYTGRLLKGEKAADLPVQQATKVELYINLKTAKALGINIPNSLIGRADEVIE